MNFINALPRSGEYLIITNSCGSGHMYASSYIESEIKTRKAAENVFTRDVFKECFGEKIGSMVIENANLKAKQEDFDALNQNLTYQTIDIWLLTYLVFFKYVFTLLYNNVNCVISTQPVSLKGLILAVRFVNFMRSLFCSHKIPIKVWIVLTDLPTKDNINFFPYFKSLNEGDKEIVRIVTTHPLTAENESEEDFWQKWCNLSLYKGQVVYDDFPVRNAFRKYANIPDPHSLNSLTVKVASKQEAKTILKCCGEAKATLQPEKLELTFNIDSNDEVFFIMLGGQACIESTKRYVRKLMQRAKDHPETNQYVFVFCGASNQENCLFNQICSLARSHSSFQTKNLKIIPLSFQEDEQVAPILARSTYLIIKPGGISSMEVLKVVKFAKKIFIHYSNQKKVAHSDPFAHMLKWEIGNAKTLMATKNAVLVTPETFDQYLEQPAELLATS